MNEELNICIIIPFFQSDYFKDRESYDFTKKRLAIKLFLKLWLKIVWYNLVLEASPETPILGK